MGTAASAVIDIDVENEKAESDLKSISSALTELANNAKTAFAGVTAYVAVDQLRDKAADILGVFGEAERANARLNSTLRQTGNSTGFVGDQLSAMRDSFHETLGVAKKDMVEVQNIFARTKVIGGDVFVKAQETALDMAAAFGIDIPNAAEELSEAMQDPANELEKFRRFGIVFTDQQKAMLNQLQSSGKAMEAQRYVLDALNSVVGGAAADAANTYAGGQEKIKNRLEQLAVVGGELLSKIFVPLQPAIVAIIDTMITWVPVVEEVLTSLGGVSTAIAGWFEPLALSSTAIQEWAALVKSIFNNWDKYIAVTLLNVGANIVGFADTVAYYFTEIIPAYAKSLWSVMKDVFSQLDDLVGTYIVNMSKNMENFWEAIQSFLAGEGFNFTYVPILEGFELQLTELPKIAERELSETERIMREAASDLTMEIGADLNQDIEKRKKQAEEERKKRDLDDAKNKKDEPLTLGAGDGGQGSGDGTGTTEGLLALSSRISEAAAQQRVVTAVAAVATAQAETNDLLKGIKDKDPTVHIDVKQDAVVEAIAAQTKELKKAYEANGTFG